MARTISSQTDRPSTATNNNGLYTIRYFKPVIKRHWIVAWYHSRKAAKNHLDITDFLKFRLAQYGREAPQTRLPLPYFLEIEKGKIVRVVNPDIDKDPRIALLEFKPEAPSVTGTPYNSGKSVVGQGISKAGNRRVRRVIIEAGWRWLEWQPQSALTRWFHERFGVGRRARRIGIVALARRLLIALWRWVECGEVQEGMIVDASTRAPLAGEI